MKERISQTTQLKTLKLAHAFTTESFKWQYWWSSEQEKMEADWRDENSRFCLELLNKTQECKASSRYPS